MHPWGKPITRKPLDRIPKFVVNRPWYPPQTAKISLNCTRDTPLLGVYIPKWLKLSSLGCHIPLLHRSWWNSVDLIHAIFHPDWCNLSPLWGENLKTTLWVTNTDVCRVHILPVIICRAWKHLLLLIAYVSCVVWLFASEKQWHIQVCWTCLIALTGNSVHLLSHKRLSMRAFLGKSSKSSTLRWTSYCYTSSMKLIFVHVSVCVHHPTMQWVLLCCVYITSMFKWHRGDT